MSHFSRSSAGSGSIRGHRGASFGGNNAMRHHPYDRSPPPRYSRSPPRARHSRRSGENVTMVPLARSISSASRPLSWVEGDDMGTPITPSTSSAARPPSWYEGDDVGGLSSPGAISDYMRGASRADMDRAGRGPGTYAPSSSSNAGLGSTGPRSYDHRLDSAYGGSRAYVPSSTAFSAPRLSAREEEIAERYWNAEPTPSRRIVDVARELGAHPHMYAGSNGVPTGTHSSRFREDLEGPSGSGYTTPRSTVPGHAVSGYEIHARQPEPGLDPPNSHWPATEGPGLVRRQAIRRQPEAETLHPDPHWPATEGPGLVRRQAIRRPQPSEGMRRREELHRLREESRRRRSSDRGAMPEGTGNGPSPRERSRPRPMKRVRFAAEVERFSRGW